MKAPEHSMMREAWEFIASIAPRPLLMIAGTIAETRVHSQRAIERAGRTPGVQ